MDGIPAYVIAFRQLQESFVDDYIRDMLLLTMYYDLRHSLPSHALRASPSSSQSYKLWARMEEEGRKGGREGGKS